MHGALGLSWLGSTWMHLQSRRARLGQAEEREAAARHRQSVAVIIIVGLWFSALAAALAGAEAEAAALLVGGYHTFE